MKYDWKKFTENSDKSYKIARDNQDISDLNRHNILKDGEIELRFIRDITKAYFNREVNSTKALDVACGVGYMSKSLADEGYEVIGFDLNHDAVAIAKTTYPEIEFSVSDASDLNKSIAGHKYDLIMAREVHCFSRIKDELFHENLVKVYLELLSPGGILVIAHSRTFIRSDTKYPSISFNSLTRALDSSKYLTAGPHFMFLYKHLKLFFPLRYVISIQSAVTRILSTLSGRRWIEFFIILKK